MKQAAQKQPSETASPITLNGVFTGWADNHTIEVVVESVPTAFMVEDEVVKETLASFEEGETLYFIMEQEGEVRKTISIAVE